MLRERRLFRMFLRCMGVFFLGRGLVDLIHEFSYDLIEQTWLADWSLIGMSWMYEYLSPLACLAVGGYLFFAGRTVLDWVTPIAPVRCWECGYNLLGNQSGRCSECGVPFPVSQCIALLDVTLRPLERVRVGVGRWVPQVFIGFFLVWLLLCVAHVAYLRWEGVEQGCC
ncbi:MAG: hypothetical protein AABZ08_12670 [Planctomycetota bacterium]